MQEFKGNWGRRWIYDSSKQLGQTGGFARVFVGQSSEGEAVAVKVISRLLPGGQVIDPRLLHRELDIAEKLRNQPHEHLINVLDVAELKEGFLVVMELAEHSLAETIDKGTCEADAIEILKHIAIGLNELHQAAVIHRDLKPANILLSDGKWKLSDFGIARDAELGTGNPTFLGWGTCAYMAPELWENRSPTFKSDLYALGCVAVELLTGKTPFLGPDPEDFRIQHLQNQPTKPTKANPALAVSSII
jgi:serine/threonine-protein kinase